MLARAVRVINVSVAILIVLIALAVYWFAYRPLPQTTGELSAPVSAAATIVRDARGVPHITAASWQDAIFLQGFVTAQDRLWQMDTLRRFGRGELAEVFGEAALNSDIETRRFRMGAIAEAALARLRPGDSAVLEQYARGVNFFIDSHRDNYALEFSLPDHSYAPRRWTVADSLVVGLVMFQDLTDSSRFELDKGTLLALGADPAKTSVLFPAMQGQYLTPGSNAWAVSGAHTADGRPMVANDPHLSYAIPGTWHLVQLKAPGLNAEGAALPGVPCVITGHNQQIAWGVTNLQADVMDLYAEQIDLKTGRYVYRGELRQAQLDREIIKIRDHKPVEQHIWLTGHGPVIFTEQGRVFSMRWTAAEGFALPFFDLDRAGNWDEFRNALRDFWGPGQNFVYGDRAGNIGYQATGRVPIRRGFRGDVPLDGVSGRFEWDGYIPFEELPSIYNPASGIIATSNQDPFPPSYPYFVAGNFADRYRIEQVRARLSAKPKLTPADMLAVQKDVYSAYDAFLARQASAACAKVRSKQRAMGEAAEVLSMWNGQMEKDQAAPAITQLLSHRLGAELLEVVARPAMERAIEARLRAEPAAGSGTGSATARSARSARLVGGPSLPLILPRPQVIQTLLEQRPSGWVKADDWDGWLVSAMQAALEEGRRLQGSRIQAWRWGRLLQWKIAHPIGKGLPLVDGFFDIGPVEMSGSGTTVKQTTATLGPSERMVADAGDWDRSLQNLPAGESGHVASSHYKDQWNAYYAGTSFGMQFEHVEAKAVLRIRPGRR